MTGMFGSLGSTFEKVTDAETTKAALPELETIKQQLDTASTGFAAIPELVRGPLVKNAPKKFPPVEAMIEKALAIPGMSDVLKPIVDSMMSKIKPLIGAAA